MKLSDLLKNTEFICEQGDIDIETANLVYDSREVIKDSVFVCISGMIRDGHSFAEAAATNGAAALIVEKDIEAIHEALKAGIKLIATVHGSSLEEIKGKTSMEDLFKEKIFKNMSKRASELLRDDLEAKGPVRISEVESAQKEILTIARRMADAGDIVLGGKGGEEMV